MYRALRRSGKVGALHRYSKLRSKQREEIFTNSWCGKSRVCKLYMYFMCVLVSLPQTWYGMVRPIKSNGSSLPSRCRLVQRHFCHKCLAFVTCVSQSRRDNYLSIKREEIHAPCERFFFLMRRLFMSVRTFFRCLTFCVHRTLF